MNIQENTLLKEPPQLKGIDFARNEIEEIVKNNQILRCSIEVSKTCNLRCPFCYANAGIKRDGEMTFDEIVQVIKQAKSAGAKTITVLGGEPLIYSRIRELIDFINDNGLTTLMFTNGTVVTQELADFLFNHNVSVIVKFNSFDDPQIQESMVGNVPGVFVKIRETMDLLIKAGFNKSNPTRLGIETVITHENLAQIPKIFRFTRQNNIYPYIELVSPAGRGKEYEGMLSQEEAKDIFYKLLKIDEKEFGFTWIPRPPQVAASCKYYFTSVYIEAYGRVQPCPGVVIELGNVKVESLIKILKKPNTIKLRNIRTNIKGKCKNCYLHDFCYGCRSAAFNITGDINAADPICWVQQTNM